MPRAILIPVCLVLLGFSAVRAEEPPKRPWSDAAELGLTSTSGNSEGTNFSLSNKFKYAWTEAELTIDALALRTQSRTRTVDNPPPYGTPVVTDTTAVTAETYALGGKYRRTISERLFWYAGASWYQNHVPANPGPGPDAIYAFEKTDTIVTAALVVNF